MSTLNVTNIAGPSNTGTAATLSSINGGPISGARNRIINGDMRIDQRNAGAQLPQLALPTALAQPSPRQTQVLHLLTITGSFRLLKASTLQIFNSALHQQALLWPRFGFAQA